MKKMQSPLFRGLQLFVGLFIALAPAVPALADSPIISDQQFHRSDVFECDGYNVLAEWGVNRRVITYSDSEGNPVEMKLIIHFEGSLTNSVSGKSLPDRGNFTVTIDLVNGTVTLAGGQRHTVEPGKGLVIQGAGRLVDGGATFEAGKWYTDEDFCRALQ